MGTVETLRNMLVKRLEPRGAKSEFCRVTGIARSALDRYLAGQGSPSLDSLDAIAKGLGIEPWQLLKPEGAREKPSPTIESLTEIIARQEKRIRDLESKISMIEDADQ